MPVRKPKVTTVLTAGALTGSYVTKGDAVDVRGYSDLTLHVRSHSGAGDIVVKLYSDPTVQTAPTAVTDMFLISAAAGTALEYTTPTTTRASFSLSGLSTNFIMVQAKYSATAGTASIWITGVPAGGGSEVGL
jgi:hypothetical protein